MGVIGVYMCVCEDNAEDGVGHDTGVQHLRGSDRHT